MTMKNRARGFRAIVVSMVALTLVLGGCALMGRSSVPDVTVVVDNNLVPGAPLTIWARPTVGSAVRVGSVLPSQRVALEFHPITSGVAYTLIADARAQGQMSSNQVILSPGDTVMWDLRTNIATLQD